MRRTRTSCSVTRVSRVLSMCVGARERTTAKSSSGEMIAAIRPTAHTAHAPALPPSPLAFSLPAHTSPSQCVPCLYFSLCVHVPPCSPSQQVLHMVLRAWWGVPPPRVSSGVSLGGRGSEGGAGGRGREQCHAFLPPPALGLHPLYVCVPTASIASWDRGHAMYVLPRPCPACIGKQAYFCGV